MIKIRWAGNKEAVSPGVVATITSRHRWHNLFVDDIEYITWRYWGVATWIVLADLRLLVIYRMDCKRHSQIATHFPCLAHLLSSSSGSLLCLLCTKIMSRLMHMRLPVTTILCVQLSRSGTCMLYACAIVPWSVAHLVSYMCKADHYVCPAQIFEVKTLNADNQCFSFVTRFCLVSFPDPPSITHVCVCSTSYLVVSLSEVCMGRLD